MQPGPGNHYSIDTDSINSIPLHQACMFFSTYSKGFVQDAVSSPHGRKRTLIFAYVFLKDPLLLLDRLRGGLKVYFNHIKWSKDHLSLISHYKGTGHLTLSYVIWHRLVLNTSLLSGLFTFKKQINFLFNLINSLFPYIQSNQKQWNQVSGQKGSERTKI